MTTLQATESLKNALRDADLAGVISALARGADVNAPYFSDHEKEPMWSKFMELSYIYPEKQETYNQIWQLVAPHARVLDPHWYYIERPSVDLIFSLEKTEPAALVVLQALKLAADKGQDYRPNLEQIFAGYGDGVHPNYKARTEIATKIMAIHTAVGEKLAAPATDFERSVSAVISDESRAYWSTPLKIDLAAMPQPSLEYKSAREEYIDAGKILAGDRFYSVENPVQSPYPNREIITERNNARVKIDELRLTGQAHSVPNPH